MTTVQAIQYTSHPERWHALAEALGFHAHMPPQRVWSEFDADGILAIHAASAEDAVDDTTELHLLVDDLDATERALAAAGVATDRTLLDDIGPLLTATSGSGVRVSASTAPRATAGDIVVQPIWYDTDVAHVRPVLEAFGLTETVASDAGTWIEFRAPGGGSIAFHQADTPGVVLALSTSGDLDALAERLAGSGIEADVHDEAYNRTALVTTPEGWRLWINGPYEDMYGYHRVDVR